MISRILHRSGPVPLLVLGLSACGGGNGTEPPTPHPISLDAEVAALPDIPVFGTDSTLDVGTWNLEWFGDAGNGPDDDALQADNVWTLLDGLGVDIWSVQEVTSEQTFADLVDQLAGYDGLLATDSLITDGAAYYSDFGGNEMKVGLLYWAGAVTVDSGRVILTEEDFAFAGRPPVLLHVTVTGDGGSLPLVVVLLHAKAGADLEDRARRETGATALKAYLDANHAGDRVILIGDLNDDVDTSIAAGQPSPYQPFVDDTAYAFPSAALSEAGISSTVFYPDVIDHHLVTAGLMAEYDDGSVTAIDGADYLADYGQTTSDHYPIVARYAPPGGEVVFTTGGLRHVALAWTGSSAARVDIERNGAVVATTANDGAWIDSLDPNGEAVYRVCEAGTSTCSAGVTVRF